MILITFETYWQLLFFILSFSSYWCFFLKNNFFFLRKKPFFFEKLTSTNFLQKLNYKLLLNFGIIIQALILFHFWSTYEQESYFFWNHCQINNNSLTLVFYLLILNLSYLLILFILNKNSLSINVEYLFAILNINTIILLIFLTNTFYTLMFVLELISCLMFYKFTVSKFWFSSKHNTNLHTTKLLKLFPKYYVNMLFFQYWSTFFSSILLFFSLINLFKLYGSSEWIILNFLINIDYTLLYFSKNEIIFNFTPLLFALFLKLGLTPLHLYKIESYKGLPLIAIFFYTTYYFFIYFLFFVYFILSLTKALLGLHWLVLFVLLLFGCLYLISLLFDGFLIKSFFGYSTVINSLNFVFIIFFSL